jgi:DNA-binding MarR family transcriptional regulator
MDDPLALERQVCFALATASRSVIKLYRPVLEPLGLTHPQYLVMLALWERSPRTLRDIADALLLEPPTLTPLLKRLEVAGLLERRRNPADERELGVELTGEGRALRTRAEQVPVRIAQQLGLPLEFLDEVRGALDVLSRASRAAAAVA